MPDVANLTIAVSERGAAQTAATLNKLNVASKQFNEETNRSNPLLRLQAHNLANLNAQMADLVVGFVSGQNMGRLFIQQGLQIIDVYAGAGINTVGGALRATGAALKNFLLNPLTLTTFGFAAAGYAAQLFYDKVLSSSSRAERALKDHQELVDRIGKSYKNVADIANTALDSPALARFLAQQDMARISLVFGPQLASARSGQLIAGQGTPRIFGQSLGGSIISGPLDTRIKNILEQFHNGAIGVVELQQRLVELGVTLKADDPLRKIITDVLQLSDELAKSEKILDSYTLAINKLAEAAKQLALGSSVAGPVGAMGARFQNAATAMWLGIAGPGGPIGSQLQELYGVNRGAVGAGPAGALGLQSIIEEMDRLRAATNDFLSTLISGLRRGQNIAEAMSNAFNRLADRFFQRGTDLFVDMLLGKQGTSGGGLLGGLFGGLFGGGSTIGGGQGTSAAQNSAVQSIAKAVVQTAVQVPVVSGPLPPPSPFTTGMANFIGNVGGQYNAGPTLASLIFGGIFGAGPAGGGSGGLSLLGAGGHGGFGIGMGTSWAGILHDGGTTPSSYRRVNPQLFAEAPRLHGGLAPDEFPAILQRGERVLSRRDAKQSSGVRMGDTFIHVEGSVDERTLTRMQGMIEANNAKQQRELTRNFGGAHQRYSLLRG